MSHAVPLYAVLACELLPEPAPERIVLARDDAEALVRAVAADLQRLLPGIEQARLLLGAALLDGAEILRPGFPAHAALSELGLRLPRGDGAVVGIGAHHDRMPAQALQPDAQFAGAPMRYLPLLIEAEPAHAAELGTRLEQVLADAGEAGGAAADRIMRACGLRLAHARYLSLADLLALTCVQYEHAGFAAHWPLIEAALLTPARYEQTLSPRGAHWAWTGARIALETPRAFLRRTQPAPETRVHGYAAAVFELRQAAALFAAHGLPLGSLDDAPDTAFHAQGVVEALITGAVAAAAPLLALRAPGLGVVALLRGDTELRRAALLATPLTGGGLPALRRHLGDADVAAPIEAPLAEVDADGVPWPARAARH